MNEHTEELIMARTASDAVTIRTVDQLDEALCAAAERYEEARANEDTEGQQFAKAETAALKTHPLYPALLAAWAAESLPEPEPTGRRAGGGRVGSPARPGKRGGRAMIKAGEAVWFRDIAVEADDVGVWLGDGDCSAWSRQEDVLPDSTALPAVARWLATYPAADRLTGALEDASEALGQWIEGLEDNGTWEDMESAHAVSLSLDVVDSLLAALERMATADGEAGTGMEEGPGQ